MIRKFQKYWRKSLVIQRFSWMICIVFIYMLGRQIPIPTVGVDKVVLGNAIDSQLIENFGAITGIQFSSMTLFTLGIGPTMTMMILWRFLVTFKLISNWTSDKVNRLQFLMTLAIALLQSYGITNSSEFLISFGYNDVTLRIITIILLTTGTLILNWLCKINSERGIGGMTVVILVNMILAFQSNTMKYFTTQQFDSHNLIQFGILFCTVLSVLVYLTILLYKGEYRIPIRRVGLNTPYHSSSYLPIRVTPAGAMPFMYGMTLMLLPPYIFILLLNIFPNNQILEYLSIHIGLSQVPGVICYIILLYLLSIGFSYYNYDPYEISKNMRNNGDYISGKKPGEETLKYLRLVINSFAQFGAFTVVVLGGLPLLAVSLQGQGKNSISIALLISNAYIIVSLLLGVMEQVDTMNSWKKYKNLI